MPERANPRQSVDRRSHNPPLGGADSDDLDLGDAILTPGLINPHTHLELTCYAGQLPPGPFWPWIAQLIALRRQPGQIERETQAVIDGAWQSLRAGVTCVGDISRRNLAWKALKPIPIRKVCFVELLSIADDPPRDCDELRAAIEDVKEDDLLHVGVSPHAPWSVPAPQVQETIFIARENKRPWTMHVAETRAELAFLRGDASSLPPPIQSLIARHNFGERAGTLAEYLRNVCSDEYAGALVHLNYLEQADMDALAALPHVAIYCPRAHRFFSHPPHPFPALRRAGVPVAIGTDSAASNQSLSPLEELQFVAANITDRPSAAELFEMVTLTPARALGIGHRVGSLETGKQADLAAFPIAPEAPDPLQYLIEQAPPAIAAWVAGQKVYRRGRRGSQSKSNS